MIQNTSHVVPNLNQSALVRTMSEWKGWGVEAVKQAAEKMQHYPLTSLIAANALFFMILSRPIIAKLEHSYSQPNQVRNKLVGTVMVLGSLTAAFNYGMLRWSGLALNRLFAVAITATILLLKLLFSAKSYSFSPPSRRDPVIQPTSQPIVAPLPQRSLSQEISPPSMSDDVPPPVSLPTAALQPSLAVPLPPLDFSSDPVTVSQLKMLGFTEEQLSELVRAVDVDSKIGIITLLDSFCYRCLEDSNLLLSLDSDEKRSHLIRDLIQLYKQIEVTPESEPVDRFSAATFQLQRSDKQDLIYFKNLHVPYENYYLDHSDSVWAGHSGAQMLPFLKSGISSDWTVEVSQLLDRLEQYTAVLVQEGLWQFSNKSIFLERLTSELMAKTDFMNGVLLELDQIFEGIKQNLSMDVAPSSQLNKNSVEVQRLLTFGFTLDHLESICREVGGEPTHVINHLHRRMSQAPLHARTLIAKTDIAKKIQTARTNAQGAPKNELELLDDVLDYQLGKHRFRNVKYTETDEFITVFAEGTAMSFQSAIRILAGCFEHAQQQHVAVPVDPRAKAQFMKAFMSNLRGKQRVPLNLNETHIRDVFIQTLQQDLFHI